MRQIPGVTKDQIERARQYDVLDYAQKYESNNIKRVGSAYRMRDHPSIEIKKGKWRWYSRGLYGKTALDYLTDVKGYGLVDAVCMLLNEEPMGPNKSVKNPPSRSIVPNAKPPPATQEQSTTAPPERLPFALPLHNRDNKRVLAYLQSRGIDRQIILDCIERGSLYERATSHDCVFVGKDENGKTRFAAMRSTTSSFMRDADGSDKKYGFLLPPDNPGSTSVAAFEAPVDALSHQTLCKQGLIPPFDGWRLSLGGISTLALEYFLKQHTEVTHCLVCTDNDEAGEMVAAKIAELSGITSERSPPIGGNDYNDALQAMQKAERVQNRTRHNGTPCL